ncbi:MAG: DUF5309 family protein [Armatimonadetes bacterium]|nr:DUF5309 family protein [Armatimonadota bacterium]
MVLLQTWQELGTRAPLPNGTIVEDLRDFVENVSAVDRPALALLRKSRVRTAFVEWNEDTLPARGHNAVLEGQAATQPDLTIPSRLHTAVQTFARWGQVSDLQRAVEHVGMEDMELYQESKAVKATLNDMEHTIHRGSYITGNTDSTRQFAGFLNISNSYLTEYSGVTLTENQFGDLLQMPTDNTADVTFSVAFVNSWLKRTISGYNTKITRNIEAAARRQLLVVDRYTGDFGDVDVYYSRDQLKSATATTDTANSIVLIDPQYFELGWLQSLIVEQLARDGLRTQFQVSAMMTLIYRTPKALGGASNCRPYIAAAT